MQPRPGTSFTFEVNPRIPGSLARLEELANNLWYSWDRPTRALFARLNPALWDAVGHSPKAFLKSIDERVLVDAAGNEAYLRDFNRVIAAYDRYHGEPARHGEGESLRQDDLVAYFCAEFGFHESLPIYSGGLGILAGDYCKTASDMRIPFVAVGLLYRQGYFQQSIDNEGDQHALNTDSEFGDLPVTAVLREDGSELHVAAELADGDVGIKVWRARVGRVSLYLLDTDLESNTPEGREIAHRLYGGDRKTRIEQEIVLGVGGARALNALGLKPTLWHINEGHAAFLVLERIRALMREGLDFAGALEATAASTVFTTHTAVAAGHDHFSEEMIARYFQRYCRESGLRADDLLALGRMPGNGEFNMTALAVRGSRFQNGVSRVHGGVSARILGELWPQVPPEENPVAHVTNGVHIPTFLAPEWSDLFDHHLGTGWHERLSDPAVLEPIATVPEQAFWNVRRHLKTQMLHLIRYRVREQHFRNHGNESHLDRLLKLADPANPDVLTIGFGRRFATYKRATLLFENIDWLRRIVSDPQRPVLFLFAGKAHPADQPAKDLLKRVVHVASQPEFEGKILFVEGYDLRLARRMVSGVDVWLNNPVYPLEACGTSGMKAGINGVINLSVLDGWWEEGYRGDNGWAVKPASQKLDHERRNREECRSLFELLQDRVIPLYYKRGGDGLPSEWIGLAKRSMASLLPRFNTDRMLGEYLAKFYVPGSRQGRRYCDNGCAVARDVAAWKRRVRDAWAGVAVRHLEAPKTRARYGEVVPFEVGVRLNGLRPEDIVVELVLAPALKETGAGGPAAHHAFVFEGTVDQSGEHRFALRLTAEQCGRAECRIRAYPYRPELTHRFELGLMKWI
jgi:starch phosphorylase